MTLSLPSLDTLRLLFVAGAAEEGLTELLEENVHAPDCLQNQKTITKRSKAEGSCRTGPPLYSFETDKLYDDMMITLSAELLL